MTVTCRSCGRAIDVDDNKIPAFGLMVKCPGCQGTVFARPASRGPVSGRFPVPPSVADLPVPRGPGGGVERSGAVRAPAGGASVAELPAPVRPAGGPSAAELPAPVERRRVPTPLAAVPASPSAGVTPGRGIAPTPLPEDLPVPVQRERSGGVRGAEENLPVPVRGDRSGAVRAPLAGGNTPRVLTPPPVEPRARVLTPPPPAEARPRVLTPPPPEVVDLDRREKHPEARRPEIAGALPGLDDMIGEELGRAPGRKVLPTTLDDPEPIIDLPVPRGYRGGAAGTGPLPRVESEDTPDLVAPKARMRGPVLVPRMQAPSDDEDRTPLPPAIPGGGFAISIDLDEDAAKASRPAPVVALATAVASRPEELPLELELEPPPARKAPVAEAVVAVQAVTPPVPIVPVAVDRAPPAPERVAPVRKAAPKPRLGRTLIAAGGAAVLLAGAGGALVAFTDLGEPLRRSGPHREDVERAVAGARRLLGEDTVASYRRAATMLHEAATIDPRARAPRALQAQAQLAVALLGFQAETKQADRVLGELTGEPLPAEAADVAKARALRLLVDGKRADAEAALQPALTGAPDAAALGYLGWIKLASGDPAAALAAFKKALAVEPKRAQALYGAARASEQLDTAESRKEALEAYRKALGASPSHLGAALGVERLTGGDPAPAEERVQALLKAEAAAAGPRDLAEAWTLLGTLARAGGRLGEAEGRYRKAIGIFPMTPTKIALARTLSAMHRSKDAIELVDPIAKAQPPSGAALVALAEAQLEGGRFADAAQTLGAAEKIAPKAEVSFLKGRVEEVRGGPGADDRAAALFREAAAADPNAVDVLLALARALARGGRSDEADRALSQAEAKASADPNVRDRLGEAYLENGELAKAEAAFRDVIARAPELLGARFHLADTLERAGRLDEAAKIYEELAQANRALAGLQERRGRLALRRGRVDEALTFYGAALAADPHPAPALRAAAGEAFLRAGKLDEARAQLETAVNEDDRSAAAHLGLARLALARGRDEDAETEARRAIQLGGGAEAQLTLGRAEEELGHLPESKAAYDLAAKGADVQVVAEARLGRARVLVRAGAVKDALVEATALAAAMPGSAAPLVLMGDCYQELAQGAKARKSYEAALKKDPGSAEAAFKVARTEAEAGHDKAAALLLDKALGAAGERAPFAAEALLLAGEAHRRLGDKGAAVMAYRKFLAVARADAPERRTVERALADLGGGAEEP